MVDVYNDNYITNQEKRQAKEEGTMNKQEVIDKLKAAIPDKTLDDYQRVEEIGEVTVPQFVADWYEEHKDYFEWNLYEFCVEFHKQELPDDLHNWFRYSDNKPIETLVKMKLFGYEVEKKKLYLASFKDTNQYLGWNEKLGEWFMSGTPFTSGVKQTQETWEGVEIWNNPAFEIKEVEE